MYKVVETFADLKDFNYIYNVGDIYPREGMSPTPERIEELSTSKNRLRIPLIKEVSDKPKKTARSKKETDENSENEKGGKRKKKTE